MVEYPVIFSTDDNYALYVTVTIQSLIETTGENQNLKIYVLYEKLCETTIAMFQKLQNSRLSITLKKVEKSVFEATYESDYFTTAMYYRLVIAQLFPEYEKVLYIDCDIILKQNIAALFDLDLSDYVLGVVYEFVDKRLEDYLVSIGYTHSNYFNSGVLLINCQEFSKHQIAEKCLYEIQKGMRYKYPDQDILNIICAGLVYPIDTKWNFKPFYSYITPSFSKQDREQYEIDKKAPALVHYTTGFKPWNYPGKYLSNEWWKTAKNLGSTFGIEGEKIYWKLLFKLFKFKTIEYLRKIKKKIVG